MSLKHILEKGKRLYFGKWEQLGPSNRYGEGHEHKVYQEELKNKPKKLGETLTIKVPVKKCSSWSSFIEEYYDTINQSAPRGAQAFKEIRELDPEKEWDQMEDNNHRIVARKYEIEYSLLN